MKIRGGRFFYSRLILAFVMSLCFTQGVFAEGEKKPAEPGKVEPAKVEVDKLKKKYWNRGEESELHVVQNRLYNKAGRVEVGALGGVISTDPFLSVRHLGLRAGYHIDETWSVFAVGWKAFSSKSSAQTQLAAQNLSVTTNAPKAFYGGEVAFSPIYGKLSVMGNMIIHYDFHLLGGGGITSTHTGSAVTPFLGLGQQMFLSQHMVLRLDYRSMYYKAKLPGGTSSVTNWTDVISLGFSVLF